ncbi:hypothetical protein HX063_12910 [Myroides odoratimimus]|uniref:hypothetical protein n=1 Tax=Myroides odoratimimus TaxID=76832 RepID=UPI002578C8DF|nr:hypothetical protein [Myroides odoratimimus]MDM1496301.1 hypothetical protein [Myroides odoratimimus]
MKVAYITLSISILFISCGTKDKLTSDKDKYKKEYEQALVSYNKNNEPQIYNNSNAPVLEAEKPLILK